MFSVQFAQSVWPVVNKTQVLGSATRPCGWPWQLILYFYTLLSGSFLPPDVRGTNQSSAALVIHQLNAHRVTERAWLIKGTSDLSFYLSPKMIELLGRDRPLWQRARSRQGEPVLHCKIIKSLRASDATHEQFAPSETDQQQTLTHTQCCTAPPLTRLLSASAALFTLGVPKVHGPNGLERSRWK
jgi:hypothetical protein